MYLIIENNSNNDNNSDNRKKTKTYINVKT